MKFSACLQNVLFPALNTTKQQAAMFIGPPIVINGRFYVGASPGVPTDAAAGAQYCLWPDPVSPRNCGPPGQKQSEGILVMREIQNLVIEDVRLGPMFWASGAAPEGWEAAGAIYGIKTLAEMDKHTQHDMKQLRPDLPLAPCDLAQGTLKCEACIGGCQLYDRAIPHGAVQGEESTKIGNERAHYSVPKGDVILYRSGSDPYLFASVRAIGGLQTDWSVPVKTDIPNDESNLNAGHLPDGRVYLLNNPVYEPKLGGERTSYGVTAPGGRATDVGALRFRDPITVATSAAGVNFDSVAAVISCTKLSKNSTCAPRHQPGGVSGGKNPGPSYPQGLTVVAPAPAAIRGFYVVCSNNKEDIWITKLEFESF